MSSRSLEAARLRATPRRARSRGLPLQPQRRRAPLAARRRTLCALCKVAAHARASDGRARGGSLSSCASRWHVLWARVRRRVWRQAARAGARAQRAGPAPGPRRFKPRRRAAPRAAARTHRATHAARCAYCRGARLRCGSTAALVCAAPGPRRRGFARRPALPSLQRASVLHSCGAATHNQPRAAPGADAQRFRAHRQALDFGTVALAAVSAAGLLLAGFAWLLNKASNMMDEKLDEKLEPINKQLGAMGKQLGTMGKLLGTLVAVAGHGTVAARGSPERPRSAVASSIAGLAELIRPRRAGPTDTARVVVRRPGAPGVAVHPGGPGRAGGLRRRGTGEGRGRPPRAGCAGERRPGRAAECRAAQLARRGRAGAPGVRRAPGGAAAWRIARR